MMDEVKGLKELNEKLEKLAGIKSKKSLLAGAYLLQKYSMENAPVKTGFLRESHESTETENGAEMIVNAEYGIYVEYGTEKMAPRGFVRKAIDEHEKDIVEAVANQIQKDIKEKI